MLLAIPRDLCGRREYARPPCIYLSSSSGFPSFLAYRSRPLNPMSQTDVYETLPGDTSPRVRTLQPQPAARYRYSPGCDSCRQRGQKQRRIVPEEHKIVSSRDLVCFLSSLRLRGSSRATEGGNAWRYVPLTTRGTRSLRPLERHLAPRTGGTLSLEHGVNPIDTA